MTDIHSDSDVTAPQHAPNWMLMLVCLIAAITALWEGLHASGGTAESVGYLALGVGMTLFAVEAVVDERRQLWLERTQVPAVLLTLMGVVLLCLGM